MKINKLKYLMMLVLLFLFTILIIGAPKLYFLLYDKNNINKYEISSLNLTNLYDHNNLSNDKKIELLMNANTKQISFKDNVDKEEYLEIIKIIEGELKKIDEETAIFFDELFNFNFEDIFEINVMKIYISNEDYDSFTLKRIDYYSDNGEVTILMDADNFTIFNFEGICYENTEKDYYIGESELTSQYIKYLQVSKKWENIFAYRTDFSIHIDAYDDMISKGNGEIAY